MEYSFALYPALYKTVVKVGVIGVSITRLLIFLTSRFFRWIRANLLDRSSDEDTGEQVPPKPGSFDFLFEQIEKKLDQQSDLWDSADRKLQLVLGFIGIVFAIAQGVLLPKYAPQPGQPAPAPVFHVATGEVILLAIVLLFLAGLWVIYGYWPRSFSRPPEPEETSRDYLERPELITRGRVYGTMIDAYNKNAAIIERKGRAFKWAFSEASAGVGLIGAALFAAVARETPGDVDYVQLAWEIVQRAWGVV